MAMVVGQLAERSLPTPEIRGLNPDIGNISTIFICQLLSRKDENKVKEAGNGPFFKNFKKMFNRKSRVPYKVRMNGIFWFQMRAFIQLKLLFVMGTIIIVLIHI